MLKSVYQKADEGTVQKTFESVQQSLSAMGTHPKPSLDTRADHSDNREGAGTSPRPEEVNLEDFSIHFLRTYSIHPNWKQIISSCNDYGQTMAHTSVTLGYLRLLRHLFMWEIDLNVADTMGLTALHYAYLFKQEECAKFLIHSGVDQFVLDDLGRSPSDLDPSLEVKLHSIMGIDGNSHAEGASPIECDTEIPDEARELHAKHFLLRQWMRQGEDERKVEVPSFRCRSPPRSAGSPSTLGSADEEDSSFMDVRIPEENFTPVVAEEMNSEASIEIADNDLPPSPFSAFSAQTQETKRPSDIGQNPFSHPAPIVGTVGAPNLERPRFYHKDPLVCQTELIVAVDIRFLSVLNTIFSTEEWMWQSQPIPRKLLKALCLKDPLTDRFTCVFCPDRTFNQSGRAIEHLQQHFGLYPFYCTKWYGLGPHCRSLQLKVF